MTPADEFRHKTTAVKRLWHTDFTYFKVTAWRLCTTRKAEDC
jgi:hypothetical protein